MVNWEFVIAAVGCFLVIKVLSVKHWKPNKSSGTLLSEGIIRQLVLWKTLPTDLGGAQKDGDGRLIGASHLQPWAC